MVVIGSGHSYKTQRKESKIRKMRPSKSIREHKLKSTEVDVKEERKYSDMCQGPWSKNALSVQWMIHFPVPYELRRLWAVSWCTHESNSLEVTFLFSDIGKINWNYIHNSGTFCVSPLWWCERLPRDKWTVAMKGISSKSWGRANRTRSSTEHPLFIAHCTTLQSTTINSIAARVLFHSCT